jgi:nitrilase
MSKQQTANHLKIGIAQISPVWLNRQKTLDKILEYVKKASKQDCQLLVFGEALLPGYPFWVDRTDGARFNSPLQKELYAHYLQQAVQIESGHLQPLCELASKNKMAIYLGCVERPKDRGGHSLYCSLVYVDSTGKIQSVHRKLMPTYEERLTWAIGDGHGLRVHSLGSFTVGGLNCWENWMPLSRAALYGLGEDLHVAVWPGSDRNTSDITRFIAKEARSFVISASGLMRKSDISGDIPHGDLIRTNSEELLANGGSCLAGPDGEWVIEPQLGKEELLVAAINHQRVFEERQNFDPAGHYSRPDVTRLMVNRSRQGIVSTVNGEEEI